MRECEKWHFSKTIVMIVLFIWNVWVSGCCSMPKWSVFQVYHDEYKLHSNNIKDQHAEFDFYSDNSLKQQSVGRHVAPLWHINLIPRQPVFAFTPLGCVLSGIQFYSIGLIRPGSNSRTTTLGAHYQCGLCSFMFDSCLELFWHCSRNIFVICQAVSEMKISA
jgi:hypothetical protein